MVGLLSRDQGRVGGQGVVDPGVGHLVKIKCNVSDINDGSFSANGTKSATGEQLTKLVWNSFKSTFRAPSNLRVEISLDSDYLREAVIEEMI